MSLKQTLASNDTPEDKEISEKTLIDAVVGAAEGDNGDLSKNKIPKKR